MLFSNHIYSNYFKSRIKYVLPILASLLTYVIIGQFYTSLFSENDLISLSGKMSAIRQDIFLHDKGRSITRRVSIKLLNYDDNFFLFDNKGENYELIKQSVNIGDTVSILHRTKLQSLIGFGNKFQIFRLEKSGNILYPFDKAKQTFGPISIFEVLVMAALWFLYFYFKHQLKLQEI